MNFFMKAFEEYNVVKLNRTMMVLGGLVAVLFCVGCSRRIGDFNALSSKNIYCENTDLTKLPKTQGVEGKDVTFLGIGADLQDALDRALEEGDGNLMVDAVVYIDSAPFVAGYRIRGTVIKVPYTSAVDGDAGK